MFFFKKLFYRHSYIHFHIRIFQMLQYLPGTNYIDIIAREFNYDLLKGLENEIMINYVS